MNKPMVSIIIPVYNGSNYLREAIDSALNQDYDNYEIIVVNDGSIDQGKTEEIALSYEDKIRYYWKENGGVATALNYGISKMKGEYFSWLSHDDIYYPDKLSAQIKALYDSGDLTALVYSDYDLWDMNRDITCNTAFQTYYSMEQLTNSVFPVLQWLTLSCTPLVHKSCFDRVGLFDEGLITAQDYDMWFRLFRYGKSVFVYKPLLKSRMHAESGTNTIECFKEELGKVVIKSLLQLSESEITAIFRHPAIIYHRVAMILKGYQIPHYYQIAMKSLQSTGLEPMLFERLQEFEKYIDKISDGKANKICIFGGGQYGQRLYWELDSRLIYIDCFSDNNPRKWGTSIEGKQCISPQDLMKIKDETLVIVAVQMPEVIIEQLKQEGFSHITTMQQMEWRISQTIPLKWISALEDNEDSEELPKDATVVKDKLNQAIFDICKNFGKEKQTSHKADFI
ncbi:MAG TPA: glycosyltransferase [Mobilitalea sp.]|nr:glycosyltransferase [Mobilitalea sp.]